MEAFLAVLESSALGRAVAESLLLTASLSAAHVVGFTLATGGALVANLRRLGVLLADRPVLQVTSPASRILVFGLAISIATGSLLFAGRATTAAGNGIFQVKMLLLVAAVASHFVAQRTDTRQPHRAAAAGALGLALWTALSGAACAFILLE
jgi:hypothetical protein